MSRLKRQGKSGFVVVVVIRRLFFFGIGGCRRYAHEAIVTRVLIARAAMSKIVDGVPGRRDPVFSNVAVNDDSCAILAVEVDRGGYALVAGRLD